ncbi:betaine aldehyde dehydrogenase [Fusarium oxysporum f. sp. phaseoli]
MQAFPIWSQTPVLDRSRVLLRVAQILRQRNDELAMMETRDTGKAFSETSTVDIAGGADVFEFYGNLIGGGDLNGESIPVDETSRVEMNKEPLGVCLGIGAWNYPMQIALWKAAPCLAAGNTMVYKPSEYTPAHGTVLAAILTETGCPPGTFNVVQGKGSVGAYLASHPLISKVSFTGQVSTGQMVASSAVQGMKYVTMELGGKSPLIVLPDCDVEDAVNGAMMANYFASGQICTMELVSLFL